MTCQSPYLSENHHAHSTGPPALAPPVLLHRHQCAHTSDCSMPFLPLAGMKEKLGKGMLLSHLCACIRVHSDVRG